MLGAPPASEGYGPGASVTLRGRQYRDTVHFDPQLPPGVVLATATAAPDPDEREAAVLSPRAAASRRRDFALGRAAAHQALRSAGATSTDPILKGDHGEPLWPAGFVGSITHAQGVGLALVAPLAVSAGVGIDMESTDRYFPGLLEEIGFDEERRHIGELPRDEAVRETVALFAAKESLYKALFPIIGRFFGFEAARTEHRQGGMAARIVGDLHPAFPAERVIPVSVEWDQDLVLATVVLEPV